MNLLFCLTFRQNFNDLILLLFISIIYNTNLPKAPMSPTLRALFTSNETIEYAEDCVEVLEGGRSAWDSEASHEGYYMQPSIVFLHAHTQLT